MKKDRNLLIPPQTLTPRNNEPVLIGCSPRSSAGEANDTASFPVVKIQNFGVLSSNNQSSTDKVDEHGSESDSSMIISRPIDFGIQ